MLSLSKTLTDSRTEKVVAIIQGYGRFATALTNPFCAESWNDCHGPYRRYLWQAMHQPHCSVYKCLARLARAHKAGKHVVLRTHQATYHGEILIAAIHYLAEKLPDLPKSMRTLCASTAGGSAHVHPWLEKEEDHLIDERRFVWVIGRSAAKLAYLWDTEGVLTALLPEHGLVKVGRCAGNFWFLRKGGVINAHVRTAHIGRHGLTPETEQVFSRLIQRQQQQERSDIAYYHKGGHSLLLPDKIAYDERYDPWALQPEEVAEEPNSEEQLSEAETEAFLTRYSQDTHSPFHKLLPTAYKGEHVRPVIKTKPDGSRWILTPELQARGALHLYQPL